MAELPGKTFSELESIFEAHTGTSGDVDSSQLVIWFNEAQVDLAIDLRLPEMPAPLDPGKADAKSELPAVLHDLLPIFAASRYYDMESDGDSEESMHGTKWMSYYQQGKDLRKSMLNFSGTKMERWIIVED